MNLPPVLISLFKPCIALAAAGGALLLSSCETPPPPMAPPFGLPQPSRFGHNGTMSPTYPNDPRAVPGPATVTPPKIVRDPNNTVVDVSPPPVRTTGPTELPPTVAAPTEPTPAPVPTPKPREDLPYGIPVVGKKGMVYSPYAPEKGQVDVDGYKRGTRVECPYTGKHFRVP